MENDHIQAIETIYNGYRFRSRLEARWAVFFDAINIRYNYEPEGFELPDGTKYLPDFWLPDWETWIEIKGEFPKRMRLPLNQQEPIYDSDVHKCYLLSQSQDCLVLILYGTPGEDPYFLDFENESGSTYLCRALIPNSNIQQLSSFITDEKMSNFERFCLWRIIKHPDWFVDLQLDEYLTHAEREGVNQLIAIDRRYFEKKYHREHPWWIYGWQEWVDWVDDAEGRLILDYPVSSRPKPRISQALLKARQARFEFGETPVA